MTGKVTDEAGKPIAQARIRTRFQSDVREAVTGADGVYHLGGCEPQMARIAVSAKGHATDMREVPIDQGMRPVDFQMKPGATVRVRVIDEHGRPIAKARILVQEWRGHFQAFEFDLGTQYTDENGVWQWNEAPLDEFKADICRPGGMELSEQSLVARKQEYVFQPPDSLVVSGTVVDGETKRPIKSFRVVPGTRHSQRNRVGWNRLNAFTVSDGHYRLRERNGSFSYLIRIEADGYRPADSREIKSNEGHITINFELARGQDVDAVVLTPDGRPASGAGSCAGDRRLDHQRHQRPHRRQLALRAPSTDRRLGPLSFPAAGGDFLSRDRAPLGVCRVPTHTPIQPPDHQLGPLDARRRDLSHRRKAAGERSHRHRARNGRCAGGAGPASGQETR